MSNFNIALLKTLSKSLNNELEKTSVQLTNLLDSKIDVSQFTGAEEMNIVANAFAMIKAWGEYDFTLNLHALLKAIKEDKITDDNRFYQAIKISRNATKALINHLKDLVEKDSKEVSIVSLWPIWSEIGKFLGKKDLSVNNLFAPYANFNDVKFEQVSAKDLYDTAEDIKERFDTESKKWLEAASKDSAIMPLRKMIDIIDTLYQLRHTIGYQSYWLALKGRLVLALSDPNAEVDNKVNLAESISKASHEIRSFANGKKNIDISLLKQLILPLLSEKAQELSLKNNTISEVYQRFDIAHFLREAKNVLSIENQEKIELFNQNIPAIKQAQYAVKESWAKHITVEGDKKDLLASIKNLLMKKDIFPQNGTTVSFLTSIYSVFNKYKQNSHTDKIDSTIGKEFATLLIMFDKYVEQKCIVSESFQKQVELQAKRVELTLLDRQSELAGLPLASWDESIKKNEQKASQLIAISEVKKDFDEIERILDDVLRGNEEGLENISKVDAPARMAIGALTIMKEGAAVNVLTAIRKMSANIAINQKIEDSEREAITLSMSGLGLFFNALEAGDKNAIMMLAPAVKLLFGKDLVAPKEIPNFNFNVGEKEYEFDLINSVAEETPENSDIPLNSESVISETEVEPVVEEPESVIEPEAEPVVDEFDSLVEPEDEPVVEEPESVFEPEVEPVVDEFDALVEPEDEPVVEESESVFEPEVKPVIEETPEVTLDLDSMFKQEKNKETAIENKKEESKEEVLVKEKTEEELAVEPHLITFDKEDPSCFYADYLQEIISDIKPAFDDALEEIHENPSDHEALKSIRRTFHTLKGSGKQVSLWSMGYMGQYVEYRFNEILAQHKPWTPELENLSVRTVEIFVDWAEKLLEEGEVYFDPQEIFNLLDEEELARGLDSIENNDEEDEDFSDMDSFELPTIKVDNEEDETNKLSIKPESTSISDIASIFNNNKEEDEEESVLEKEEESISEENESVFEPEVEPLSENIQDEHSDNDFVEEVSLDERNVEDNTDSYGVDKIDPIETESSSPSDYLPVFDDVDDSEVLENEESHVEVVENELFIKIDTLIDNIRSASYIIENDKVVPESFVDYLEEVKEIAHSINYNDLEDVTTSFEAKIDEVMGVDLIPDDISNIILIKDVIVDALIRIVDNDTLLEIDEKVYDLINDILKPVIDFVDDNEDENIFSVNDENPFENDLVDEDEAPEVIKEEVIEQPENVLSQQPEENIPLDIDKEKSLDIILEALTGIKNNIDILQEQLSKILK